MRIFDHIGCRSGQCALRQLGIAALMLDEVENEKNHAELRTRFVELKNECRRLMNEQEEHGEKCQLECGDA